MESGVPSLVVVTEQLTESPQAAGMVIYRASRLEALVDPLRTLLAHTRPQHLLAPQTVISAHPGMRQWLHGALAQAEGPGGIVANLQSLLPSAWIDQLAVDRLGQQAVSLPRWQRRHLRWMIHAALEGDLAALGISDARIDTFLLPTRGAADVARKRFQLADRLAGLYSQYLVYRPDWLAAWEHGRLAATPAHGDAVRRSTEDRLLAPLWRHLRQLLGAHRADVVGQLIADLSKRPSPDTHDALHVFGTSHLAPLELDVLRAYARHHLVAFYVPDPCRYYWGGLARDPAALRQLRHAEAERVAAANGADYWVEQGHPLLASWGRLGQHFLMNLASEGDQVLEDVRHWRDEQGPAPANRLERLQQSIRELDPALLRTSLDDDAVRKANIDDASLRVHACHTRLRELEVLRDQLLDAISAAQAAGKPLPFADIVVMAPNIHDYVPLIPAVFGVAGDTREPLPYHLADVTVARSHRLFESFERLLDLPTSRLSAQTVVDLLKMPDIARRLGLDDEAVDELCEWLRQSRVAWGLDAAFRTRFDAPPIAEHTFGWAMDRLLAGYLMSDTATDDRQPPVHLPMGDEAGSELLPMSGIHGPAAAYLGALDQLLMLIQSVCDAVRAPHAASAWSRTLEDWLESFFLIDPTDTPSREARALLLNFIGLIAREPAVAGQDPMLDFAVVRELLKERLAAVPERQRFLMGGVTFCGMVPQRAVPFRVVAVLGLNDQEFPRAVQDGGLDLMQRYRRVGDRDVRLDDRYMFLETVMSARERLHLSYIGEGERDGKPRNPASPLAELLAMLDAAAGLPAENTAIARPWLLRHALQPFDARYFDGRDPRLFSYSEAFAAMHGSGSEPDFPAFLDHIDSAPAPVPGEVSISELAAYYKDPAKHVLRDQLKLTLDALDEDSLPQDEPLDAKFEYLDTVERRLFFGALQQGVIEPEQAPPPWVSLGGLLPPGRLGEQLWRSTRDALGVMLAGAAQWPGFEGGAPAAETHDIRLAFAGWQLSGQVTHAYPWLGDDATGWQLVRYAKPVERSSGAALGKESSLSFKDRVPAFIDWATLRLSHADEQGNVPAVRLQFLVEAKDTPWQQAIADWDARFIAADPAQRASMKAELQDRLARLLQWRAQGLLQPRWYFQKTAWGTVAAHAYDRNKPLQPADEWERERSNTPGYNVLLAGEESFADDSRALHELQHFAQQLNACIWLQAEGAGA
jgi:exodeoxyribonuclease V gamma subunit